MQKNLRHMFFALQPVAPGMTAGGGGSGIKIGSKSWHEMAGGFQACAGAKVGVAGLTRNMAREFGQHAIRVNTLVPGWIMTERQLELWMTPEALERHREGQCLKQLIDPTCVARVALFLGSDNAKMCAAGAYDVTAGSI